MCEGPQFADLRPSKIAYLKAARFTWWRLLQRPRGDQAAGRQSVP